MKIYLDTKDLIELFQKSSVSSIDMFEAKLRDSNHELILSLLSILELSAPLVHERAETNVMNLLNLIERMPIRYISEAKITGLELEEALNAFTEGRTYRQVSPFVSRFDETFVVDGEPPTKVYMNFSLAETVFTLWSEDKSLFSGFLPHTKKLQVLFETDRAMPKPPSLSENFIKTIGIYSEYYKVIIPSGKLKTFAEWIYSDASRCPSIRLGYEVYHRILKNLGDMPKDGDIPDFGHIGCIPYIDLITLDNRMRNYVRQACPSNIADYESRLCENWVEVISKL